MLTRDKLEEACWTVKEEIQSREEDGKTLFIAIDGRSASGKSTFAEYLKENLPCQVIHMDDFFLPVKERREDWLEIPGGNIDFERFKKEILESAEKNESLRYRPFDCKSQSYLEEVLISTTMPVVVEGAYSCHPDLYSMYDLHIFVDIHAEQQRERILLRNGEERAANFMTTWIPLEEAYLATYNIREKCELYF